MSYSFQFLDDVAVADIAFEAEGDTAEDAFRGATQALLETMADPRTVASVWVRDLDCTAGDLPDLLFEWLSEIVYWKDAEGVVFREVALTLSRQDGGWNVQGRLTGAPVDHRMQHLRNDVKGVTKHLYEFRQVGERWRAMVVLDV